MNRYERTRLLVEGDPSLACDLARFIEEGAAAKGEPVRTLDAPREELVMVKVRETAQGTAFYLGEALMTSCRVALGDAVGYGMTLGSDHAAARRLAVIDAAFSSPAAAALEARWEGRFKESARAVEARQADEAARIASTRVDFSTMKVEA